MIFHSYKKRLIDLSYAAAANALDCRVTPINTIYSICKLIVDGFYSIIQKGIHPFMLHDNKLHVSSTQNWAAELVFCYRDSGK